MNDNMFDDSKKEKMEQNVFYAGNVLKSVLKES